MGMRGNSDLTWVAREGWKSVVTRQQLTEEWLMSPRKQMMRECRAARCTRIPSAVEQRLSGPRRDLTILTFGLNTHSRGDNN
jgi:hypothetical protein